MKFAPLTLILVALATHPINSFGQTDTWDSLTQALSQETNLEQRKQILGRILKIEISAEQKALVNLEISLVQYEQEKFGEAVYYAGQALIIVDAELQSNSDLRTRIVDQRYLALNKVGRTEEARSLFSENLKRNTDQGDIFWKSYDRGITHGFSQFHCPDFVAEMGRTESVSYNTAGIDVGCSYKVLSDKQNNFTAYFFRAGKTNDKKAIKEGGAAMLDRLPNAQKFAVEKKSHFSTTIGNPVYHTLVSYGTPQKGETYSGAWTKVIDDWILKTRVTWDVALEKDYGANKTEAFFARVHPNIRTHLDACKATEVQKTGTHIADGMSMTAITMAALIASINVKDEDSDIIVYTDTENPAQSSILPIPSIECFTHKSGGNEVALGYHPNEVRRYSLYSGIIDAVLYVEKIDGLNELGASQNEQFVLKSIKGKSVAIFNIYDGEPPALLVFQDMVKVINNKANELGSIDYENNKNTSINITPSFLGTSDKEPK